MDPITTSAIISGGASLLGGLFGRSSAKKAAKRQEQFQERMRDTQHQAEVKDLIAAGLNPILSATGGSGAASPAGAQPQGIGGDLISPAVNSALAAKLNNAQIENIKTDTMKKEAEATLTNTQQTAINNQNTLFYDTMAEQAQRIRSEAASSAANAQVSTINAAGEEALAKALGMGGQSAGRISQILGVINQITRR